MVYRISLRSNPRLFILVAILILVVATAIAVFFAFGVIAGSIALIVAVYIDYQLMKFLRLQLASQIAVKDDELHCVTSLGETLDFPWESVSHSGICSTLRGRKTIFVYDERNDKLVTIPDSFGNLDLLAKELSQYVELSLYPLKAGESVRDKLRGLVSDENAES